MDRRGPVARPEAVIGLDTNVLLRWLLTPAHGDIGSSDAEIARVADLILEAGAEFYVNAIVIAETAWILEQKLKVSRADLSETISRLRYAGNIVLGNAAEVGAAQAAFEQSNANFADCLIGQLNLGAGCGHTLTFDRKASRTPGFRHAGGQP